jgi:hypothetical protein
MYFPSQNLCPPPQSQLLFFRLPIFCFAHWKAHIVSLLFQIEIRLRIKLISSFLWMFSYFLCFLNLPFINVRKDNAAQRVTRKIVQSGPQWTDFHEIWHLSIFRKSVDNIQVSLKYDRNNGYSTWKRMQIFDHISLSSSQNEKPSDEICRQNQNTNFCSAFVFSKIVSFMRYCGKLLSRRTDHRRQYGACAPHAG